MRFDLHIHTSFSRCSNLTLDQIITHAKAKKLDGVCITDHESMAAKALVSEGNNINGLQVIVGMEYATPKGDFLIFGPFDNIPKLLPAAMLLDYVSHHGGIAVAAHPFRKGRPTDKKIITGGSCLIIEGRNGRNSELENKLAQRHAARHGLCMVGGSDAHSLEELGRVTTTFLQPIRSSSDLVNALQQGLFLLDQTQESFPADQPQPALDLAVGA